MNNLTKYKRLVRPIICPNYKCKKLDNSNEFIPTLSDLPVVIFFSCLYCYFVLDGVLMWFYAI